MSQFKHITLDPVCAFSHSETCPWGPIEETKEVAPGIDWVSCAGHAGFRLSYGRYMSMPMRWRQCSFTNNEWFEEDCSWCAVVLAYPEFFNSGMVQAAKNTFNRFYSHRFGFRV